MKGRELRLQTVVKLPYNATSIYAMVQRNTTIGVIGNQKGVLQKVLHNVIVYLLNLIL